MIKKKGFIVVALMIVMSFTASSQIRQIPKQVEETFAQQYNGASNIEFRDQLVRVDVYFELNGEKFIASYTNKGIWKETEKEFTFDQLPEEIKEGFQKSRFADRDVEETKVLYLPGGSQQYRLKAKKSDVEKKYLYFNTKGRLLRSTITI
jgi:hypothetical protein